MSRRWEGGGAGKSEERNSKTEQLAVSKGSREK